MATRRGQRGITLIGFVFVLIVAGFFAYLGMRLVPVYIEDYSVKRSLEEVSKEPGIASKTPEQIRDILQRKFYISYVETAKPKDAKITKEGNNMILQMKYESRGPLFYNVEYIASFDHSVTLGR
jgi:hypothetical protein